MRIRKPDANIMHNYIANITHTILLCIIKPDPNWGAISQNPLERNKRVLRRRALNYVNHKKPQNLICSIYKPYHWKKHKRFNT